METPPRHDRQEREDPRRHVSVVADTKHTDFEEDDSDDDSIFTDDTKSYHELPLPRLMPTVSIGKIQDAAQIADAEGVDGIIISHRVEPTIRVFYLFRATATSPFILRTIFGPDEQHLQYVHQCVSCWTRLPPGVYSCANCT